MKHDGDLSAKLHFYIGRDAFVALHTLQDRTARKDGAHLEDAVFIYSRTVAVTAQHRDFRLHFFHQITEIRPDLVRTEAGGDAHFLQAVRLLNRLLQLCPAGLVRICLEQQINFHPALCAVVEHLYDDCVLQQFVQRAVARVFCKLIKKTTLQAILHVILLAHKCR